jgi:hypothetical protein
MASKTLASTLVFFAFFSAILVGADSGDPGLDAALNKLIQALQDPNTQFRKPGMLPRLPMRYEVGVVTSWTSWGVFGVQLPFDKYVEFTTPANNFEYRCTFDEPEDSRKFLKGESIWFLYTRDPGGEIRSARKHVGQAWIIPTKRIEQRFTSCEAYGGVS